MSTREGVWENLKVPGSGVKGGRVEFVVGSLLAPTGISVGASVFPSPQTETKMTNTSSKFQIDPESKGFGFVIR